MRELKSTVTGKSFQQLTTRSLKNFDRTSAEQRFLNSLWLCPLVVERVAVSKNSLTCKSDTFWAKQELTHYYKSTLTGTGNRSFVDNVDDTIF